MNVFKTLRKAIYNLKRIGKAINVFKAKGFLWVQCLWDYVVVNALLRSYIIHHDQSGFSRPNHIFTM
jgi:hypothetical protein